jgi:hypothetical protein
MEIGATQIDPAPIDAPKEMHTPTGCQSLGDF